MPSVWRYIGGMVSLTLKSIPAGLHQRLRLRAMRNRRSLSQEALACLEQVTTAERVDPDRLLAQARRLRAGVKRMSRQDLRAWTTQGRP